MYNHALISRRMLFNIVLDSDENSRIRRRVALIPKLNSVTIDLEEVVEVNINNQLVSEGYADYKDY